MSGANENEPIEDAVTATVDGEAAEGADDDATAVATEGASHEARTETPPDHETDDQEAAETTDEAAEESYWNDIRVRAALEAMLFAADEPLPTKAIIESLPEAREETIRRAIGQMMLELSGDSRGIHLHEVAGGYQLRTNATYNEQVLLLFEAKPTKLSRAAMETLAIVAYRQPVTKAIVDEIRGVDCGGVLRGLTDLELIAVIGKADDIGRPNLYGTTQRFLEFFSLSSLTDLPTLEDFEVDALELLGEDVEHLLGERDDEGEEEDEENERDHQENARRGSAKDESEGSGSDEPDQEESHRDGAASPSLGFDQNESDGTESEEAEARLPDFPHGTSANEDDHE